jgi:hypothetical protein
MQYHDKSFYICACYAEILNVEREIDIYNYEDKAWGASICFSIWHRGTDNHKPTLRDKLRHCWRILKTGKNYADEIILSISDSKQLALDLLKFTNEDEIKIEAEKMLNARKEKLDEKIKSTDSKN